MDIEKFLGDKIDERLSRLLEVEKLLQSPDILNNREKLIILGREEKELREFTKVAEDYRKVKKNIKDAEGLLSSEDEEMKKLAGEEISLLKDREKYLLRELVKMLIPRDIDSERNAIIEIRSGAGGEEASLFAKDLYRMYSKYAETKGWRIEPMVVRHTEIGGFKEIISILKGDGVYGRLKSESGVHRVQRVPVTESGGRIHTSTCTVAVLPEAKEKDVEIDSRDIKMDFFRASGHGGQSVNKLSSAVRVTHIPTRITVECQDERSQYKNRQRAMQILLARLYEIKRKEEQKRVDKERRAQIGTGDRSLKIRTYNFRENRVTDHRINLTLYRLDSILNGDIDELIDELNIKSISEFDSIN